MADSEIDNPSGYYLEIVISDETNNDSISHIRIDIFGILDEYTYGLYENGIKTSSFTVTDYPFVLDFVPQKKGLNDIYIQVENSGDFFATRSNTIRIGTPRPFIDAEKVEINEKEVDILSTKQTGAIIYKAPNVLYYRKQKKTLSQRSANHTGYGNRFHDLFLLTAEDVYVSCTFKQTSVGRWYVGGLSICTEQPLVGTHDTQSNGGSVLICAGTGDYEQQQNNVKFRGVEDVVENTITFGKEYLFEVTRIGQTFTSKITNIETKEVVLNQTKVIENNNYKYWTMYGFEGCTFEYGNIIIKKI